VAATNY